MVIDRYAKSKCGCLVGIQTIKQTNKHRQREMHRRFLFLESVISSFFIPTFLIFVFSLEFFQLIVQFLCLSCFHYPIIVLIKSNQINLRVRNDLQYQVIHEIVNSLHCAEATRSIKDTPKFFTDFQTPYKTQ